MNVSKKDNLQMCCQLFLPSQYTQAHLQARPGFLSLSPSIWTNHVIYFTYKSSSAPTQDLNLQEVSILVWIATREYKKRVS